MDDSHLARLRALQAAGRLAAEQYGVLSWAQVLECGLGDSDVRRLRRQGVWRRLFPRVYCVQELAPDRSNTQALMLTTVMAAQLALGPRSFASAETAARLWGLQGLPPWDRREIHMTIPALGAQRHIRGITLHTYDTEPHEITTRADGIRLTIPGRTLRDVVLRVDRASAVSLMDSSQHQGLLTSEDLPLLEAANLQRRGCRRTRAWWHLTDGRAQSPLETRIRLVCVDGGLPPDDLQHPFPIPDLDVTYYGDLWWEKLRTLVEADGAGPHSGPEALFQDRRRQNAILRAYPGLRILRFTWADLQQPGRILAQLIEPLS
jgi:hypothetical protein